MYKFYVDKIAKNAIGFSKPHPNCAMFSAEPFTPQWRQFSTRWPYSEPVMLFEYMDHWDISYQLVELEDTDNNTFYPIALSFFSFDVQQNGQFFEHTLFMELHGRAGGCAFLQ